MTCFRIYERLRVAISMLEPSRSEFRLEDLILMDNEGYGFETICDSAHDNQVLMVPLQVRGRPIAHDVFEVFMETNRGINQGMLTTARGKTGSVLWVPARGGNLNGPAGGVYAELACDLQAAGINSIRMGYRDEDSFDECVLDTLAWLSFLRATGSQSIVLGGNNLGSAVAMFTAALHPLVKALVVISSAVDDPEMIDRLGPKPLLVIHGEKDTRNPLDQAMELYNRAGEPKELVIYPGVGTNLVGSKVELREKLGTWLSEQLGESDAYSAALDARDGPYPDIDRPISPEGSDSPRHLALTRDDMVDMEVDAIVSTAASWLDFEHNTLSGAILERGGSQIQEQLWAQAPLFIGDVAVTDAGSLKAGRIFHAITGGDHSGDTLTMDEVVTITTRDVLALGNSLGLKTIAIPAIGTGNRGFPIEKAAQIMVTIAASHLAGQTTLEKVTFAVVSDGVYRAFESLLTLLPE
jgi:O-acetyl-ADP-ribose deacetylase (regulator of RNase III)/alpha/beta superfamily hydrolase